MKPAERKRIARAIRSAVPGLREKGRILAATPRGRLLRGIYLEDTSDPHRVYVWAFVQPLFVPSTTVVLSLGRRLGNGSRTWAVDDADAAAAAARDEGMPFFEPVDSAQALWSLGFLDGRSDEYSREVRAYSLVASGQLYEGAQALRELARSLAGGTAWMIEMRKRAEQLATLAETNPTAADALLATWESETVSALRIEDVP